MTAIRESRLGLLFTAAAAALLMTPLLAAAADTAPPVTFTKDVAPILQAKCQQCHRPDGGAPFSMLTYQDVRPWARTIKTRVEQRSMPPWHIDSRVGTASKFRDDPSLTDDQIATIARWADAGAPQGNPADMPAPRTFPPAKTWLIGNGKPDLVVSPDQEWKMYARGNDEWVDYVVDPKLTSDVWVKSIQVMPGNTRIVHHLVVYTMMDDPDAVSLGGDAGEGGAAFKGQQLMYTFVPGKPPVIFADNEGMLLKAGTRFKLAFHYAASGKEETDLTKVGLVFHPKDTTPKYRIQNVYMSVDQEKIDVKPNAVSHLDGYYRVQKPTLLATWAPHMHQRGHAQTLEVILPNGRVETLAHVDRFDFAWQIVYPFADDVAPLLPAGSLLHINITYDNTSANRTNPDPNRWVGYGQASTDEMGGAFLDFVQLDQKEFDRLQAERKAKLGAPGALSARQ